MTFAADILHIARNATDAQARAEDLTDISEEDWEHEATLYIFSDDSVLVVSGPQCNAYASIDAARAALDA